jgi:hypothetical protein
VLARQSPLKEEEASKRLRMREFDEALQVLAQVVLKDWPQRA